MRRWKRRLFRTVVFAVVYADFLAVMKWRHREIESLTCAHQSMPAPAQFSEIAADDLRRGIRLRPFICGGVCTDPIVKRRDARPADWATLAAYTGGNFLFGAGLWWFRVIAKRTQPRRRA